MLQFHYKLKVSERVKAKCNRHPRYNPERDGRGGIKGGCSTCFSLFDLYQARLSLDAAHREFLRRASPWTRILRSSTKPQSPKQDKAPTQGAKPLDCAHTRMGGGPSPVHPSYGKTHLKGDVDG